MQIAILGLGNIGYSIVSGLNKLNLSSWAFDRNKPKRNIVSSQNLSCEVASSYKGFITKLSNCELLFLCIRTEQLGKFFQLQNSEISVPTTVLFQAGVSLFDLPISNEKKAGILRVSTNINIGSRNGYTVILKNNRNSNYVEVKRLFLELGRVLEVETEAELELHSLLSGCGPALILSLYDNLQRKAAQMGIDNYVASEMIASIVIGSVETMLDFHIPPAELAKKVGTKGGIVEKAISKLQKNQRFDRVVSEYFDKIQGVK